MLLYGPKGTRALGHALGSQLNTRLCVLAAIHSLFYLLQPLFLRHKQMRVGHGNECIYSGT